MCGEGYHLSTFSYPAFQDYSSVYSVATVACNGTSNILVAIATNLYQTYKVRASHKFYDVQKYCVITVIYKGRLIMLTIKLR